MTGLALLIPVALGLGLLGLVCFFWSLKNGQFDDADGAALRILIDEEGPL
ncbi:cbb3-type cytochrome oxidase assembly protein CcoS [Sphingorhabdus contaminans]|jgi:cbb3-type cytochrome oxidase maturation protein|uniref:Cbb3-type cytochrome oxidase assembly protein CcoS n=1 Tax=Sphingorhabdus contaminans TaxID=1343899 RepID=A0A553WAW1_9SPHN|nr:cbb3-type cytochrome oxidase assembly protein CcoS [Sphingorhabdus contaminans]TSB01802.1 cbb3-type cytochrome oxidase assembly protein CcoS [Sphingorhabdus contaminans]